MKKRLCVVCLTVSLTWATLLVLYQLGVRIDLKIPALLMGGSVVGIMYTFGPAWKIPVKALYLALGFGAAYAVLAESWLAAAILAAGALVVSWLARPKEKPGKTVEELEKKMKNCC